MNVTKKRPPTLASNDYLKKGNNILIIRGKKRQCTYSFCKNVQLEESRSSAVFVRVNFIMELHYVLRLKGMNSAGIIKRLSAS